MRYGTEDVYELEGLNPGLQGRLLTEAILAVMDVRRYNYEIKEEGKEAAFIDEKRQLAMRALGEFKDWQSEQ